MSRWRIEAVISDCLKGCDLSNHENERSKRVSSPDIHRQTLHRMMSFAFIEIRAADSSGFPRKLADIFHNLPVRLLRCSTDEDYAAEYQVLLDRARRWGMEGYLSQVREGVEKSIREDDRSRADD